MECNTLLTPGHPPERVGFSIIIPVLNEEENIEKCLEALTRLDTSRGAIEVILVDNGSTDRTIEIARRFAATLPLTILQKPGVCISALRNLGVSRSRGPMLGFLDSDCIAPQDWLIKSAALLQQKGAGVVGAHYQIPEDASWVARVWMGDEAVEKQGDVDWVPSGDMLITRETFDRLGGFDETIQTNEDCELCDRARGAGFRVVSDAAIAVIHLGSPRTLGGFYRKIRWHGTDGLRVFLRELPRVTNAGPLLFAIYTLFCLAAAILGIVLVYKQDRTDIVICSLVALLLAPFLLSLKRISRQGKWNQLLPLTVLYLVYGLARGRALLNIKSWVGSRRAPHIPDPRVTGVKIAP